MSWAESFLLLTAPKLYSGINVASAAAPSPIAALPKNCLRVSVVRYSLSGSTSLSLAFG